ncbi:MAG: hypothetical protein AAGE98_07240, partial [Actinomycetota bacterium]
LASGRSARERPYEGDQRWGLHRDRPGRIRPGGWSAQRAVAAASDAIVPDFLPEDKAICERGQRAASGTFKPGPLVAMEQVVIDFHHFLARQLHGETPPSAGGPMREAVRA